MPSPKVWRFRPSRDEAELLQPISNPSAQMLMVRSLCRASFGLLLIFEITTILALRKTDPKMTELEMIKVSVCSLCRIFRGSCETRHPFTALIVRRMRTGSARSVECSHCRGIKAHFYRKYVYVTRKRHRKPLHLH